jgi:hypothetical protein
MKNSRVHVFLVAVTLSLTASTAGADIWRWTDPLGEVHYVDTLTPIYVWLDEEGKVWYADTPDHEDAVSVELVWHSAADSVEQAEAESGDENKRGDTRAYEGETAEDRLEREQAEQYYCDRAKEIYDSYLNAPRLYRTNDAGEREYLSDEDAAATLAETKARVDELCKI